MMMETDESEPSPHRYRPLDLGRVFTVHPNHEMRLSAFSDDGHRFPTVPCARSGHCSVADENNLFVFGGYNPDVTTLQEYFDREEEEFMQLPPLFHEIWRFNFDKECWTNMRIRGPMPHQLASMSMILSGNYIIVYGGTGFPFGYTTSTNLYFLDLRDKRWRKMGGTGVKPTKSYGQAIAIVGHYLYVFGGTTGWHYNADIYRADLRTGKWEKMFDFEEHLTRMVQDQNDDNSYPLPRYRHEMLFNEKELFVIGGGTSHHAYTLDKIHTFNLSSNTWSLRSTIADPTHGFPGKRRCHGCAQLGTDGYITGGLDEKTIYDDVWRISLENLQWTKLNAKLPEPVFFHASAITPDGCLFCHGGVLTAIGDQRTDKLNYVWVKVPSLLKMAWRRILNVAPDIHKESQETLKHLGLPLHIIQQLDKS